MIGSWAFFTLYIYIVIVSSWMVNCLQIGFAAGNFPVFSKGIGFVLHFLFFARPIPAGGRSQPLIRNITHFTYLSRTAADDLGAYFKTIRFADIEKLLK